MDQAGDEMHETDIPHDHETRLDVEDQDQAGQADDETHHETDKMYHDASRYTTADGSKRNSLRMDHVMDTLDKIAGTFKRLSCWFTELSCPRRQGNTGG